MSDCQITLTQLFGGGSKEKAGENTDQDILENPHLEDDSKKEDNVQLKFKNHINQLAGLKLHQHFLLFHHILKSF